MDVVIRLANIKDSGEILKLIKELAEFENELEKVELNLGDIENHGFGKVPIFKCFVAEYLNSVVGIASFLSKILYLERANFSSRRFNCDEYYEG